MANHGISEKKIERFVITETISKLLTRMLERATADSKHVLRNTRKQKGHFRSLKFMQRESEHLGHKEVFYNRRSVL